MKRPWWDKRSDGSVISNAGLPPSSCGKRSTKRSMAKLRKNCDAHTYKRRPVNSMDPLPSRCARFQSVSLFLLLFLYQSDTQYVHTSQHGHMYACRSVFAPAQARRRIFMWKLTRRVSKDWGRYNFNEFNLRSTHTKKNFIPISTFLLSKINICIVIFACLNSFEI